MLKKRKSLLLGILLFVGVAGLLTGLFTALHQGSAPSDSELMIASACGFIVSSLIMARKHPLGSLSLPTSPYLLGGALFGLFLITLSFFGILGLGGLSVSSWQWHSDILKPLLQSFGIFVLVAFGEELFFRGFIFEHFREKHHTVKAVIISSIIFSLLHMGNPGIFTTPFTLLNIFLIGIIFAYSKVLTKSLWFPIGMHLTFNFSQGNLFGFRVSGEEVDSWISITQTGNTFINGGQFGAEGSLVTFLIVSMTAFLLHLSVKRRESMD